MTITQLETFIEIAKTMNFTTAAGNLGYAQSTVTTQIKQMEDELGCLLFERLGKSIQITNEGEKLLAYAEKILQLEREIHSEVPAGQEPSGILEIGVSESLCYNRLPHLLMEYQKTYPKVELRLRFIDHRTFPELLKNGSLDLAYTLNPLIHDDSLTMLYKRREKLGFYAAPEFVLAGKKKISEEDLKNTPLFLTSHDCTFRHLLLNDLEKHEIQPDIVLETSSKEILKRFAANGLGVAFMPDMVAERETEMGELVKLSWKGSDFPIYSQVFIHKDKHVNSAMEGLLDMIIENDKDDERPEE